MKANLLNLTQLKSFFESEISCDNVYVQKTKCGQYPQIKFFLRCKNTPDPTSKNQINSETVIQYLDDGAFFFTGKLLQEKRGYLCVGKEDYFNTILGGCCEKLSAFTTHNFSTIPQNRHYAKLTAFVTLNKNIDKMISSNFNKKDLQKNDKLKIKNYVLIEKNINNYLLNYLKQYENTIEY